MKKVFLDYIAFCQSYKPFCFAYKGKMYYYIGMTIEYLSDGTQNYLHIVKKVVNGKYEIISNDKAKEMKITTI